MTALSARRYVCHEDHVSYPCSLYTHTCTRADVTDFHHVDFKQKKPEELQTECCQAECGDALKLKKASCGADYKLRDEKFNLRDLGHYSVDDVKNRCCEKLDKECIANNKKNKERKAWVDKRPKTSAAALVTYLNKWGEKILKAADVASRYRVSNCQENNIKYKTEQACNDAHEDCCFACNDKFDCGADRPVISTCANNEPSAFMKKYGIKSCNTGGGINFNTQTKWYVYINVVTHASECSHA